MLTAINSARLKALPASPTSPGAAEWQLQEAAVPLAVTAVRAAALTGDREAVVASLQQQLTPMKPTPINVPQVGISTSASCAGVLDVRCSASCQQCYVLTVLRARWGDGLRSLVQRVWHGIANKVFCCLLNMLPTPCEAVESCVQLSARLTFYFAAFH
jgi:hypothetical protein